MTSLEPAPLSAPEPLSAPPSEPAQADPYYRGLTWGDKMLVLAVTFIICFTVLSVASEEYAFKRAILRSASQHSQKV